MGQWSLNVVSANQIPCEHLFVKHLWRGCVLWNSILFCVRLAKALVPIFQEQASKIEIYSMPCNLSALHMATSASDHPSAQNAIPYPVVAEIWSTFEATLLTQAKRLAEDIAKSHGKDPKELWSKIKGQVKIGLFDVDLTEPTLCAHQLHNREGAVRLRCRAPCTLGFNACPLHINAPHREKEESKYEVVTCVKDFAGHTYYLDSKGIARDKNGKAKGLVKEEVLYLFETG
jgi:hypothetical protein